MNLDLDIGSDTMGTSSRLLTLETEMKVKDESEGPGTPYKALELSPPPSSFFVKR